MVNLAVDERWLARLVMERALVAQEIGLLPYEKSPAYFQKCFGRLLAVTERRSCSSLLVCFARRFRAALRRVRRIGVKWCVHPCFLREAYDTVLQVALLQRHACADVARLALDDLWSIADRLEQTDRVMYVVEAAYVRGFRLGFRVFLGKAQLIRSTDERMFCLKTRPMTEENWKALVAYRRRLAEDLD